MDTFKQILRDLLLIAKILLILCLVFYVMPILLGGAFMLWVYPYIA